MSGLILVLCGTAIVFVTLSSVFRLLGRSRQRTPTRALAVLGPRTMRRSLIRLMLHAVVFVAPGLLACAALLWTIGNGIALPRWVDLSLIGIAGSALVTPLYLVHKAFQRFSFDDRSIRHSTLFMSSRAYPLAEVDEVQPRRDGVLLRFRDGDRLMVASKFTHYREFLALLSRHVTLRDTAPGAVAAE